MRTIEFGRACASGMSTVGNERLCEDKPQRNSGGSQTREQEKINLLIVHIRRSVSWRYFRRNKVSKAPPTISAE
jgi:hypothetical protein